MLSSDPKLLIAGSALPPYTGQLTYALVTHALVTNALVTFGYSPDSQWPLHKIGARRTPSRVADYAQLMCSQGNQIAHFRCGGDMPSCEE